MIEIPVYSPEGQKLESLQVDEALFGGKVRRELLRLATLRHEANQRVGTAATKNRELVEGSTKKLYRQKGTGRARAGPSRTPLRRGGGVAFAKELREFRQEMPKSERRAALDSALLAKMLDGSTCVVSKLEIAEPKTKAMAEVLKALKVAPTCLVSTAAIDKNVWKDSRNIPRLRVLPVSDLNAWEVLRPKSLVFTREAFEALIAARSKRDGSV